MKISDFDVVLFDLDGTVYYGSEIIPGANVTIQFFRQKGKKVYFTTNNSTRSRRQIFEKLLGMGIDCNYEEVITSGYLAALYAKKHNLKNIYILGSVDLMEEFSSMNVSVLQNENAENLLIGYNPNMSYNDLTDALQVALHAHNIIACNKERVFPGENKRIMPGCGAMTAPIEWCANRPCDIVVGKPDTMMVDLLCEVESKTPERFLVVGDTYESDCVMASRAGCKSVLISKYPNEYYDGEVVSSIKDVPSLF